MNDAALRELVRDVIARRGVSDVAATGARGVEGPQFFRQHASHGMFVLPAGSDGDGPCLIEPSVTCNHCGYCKSYGH